MADKQSYWIATANGYFAQVDAEGRDRFTPLGWRLADEPPSGGFVYMRHEGIEQPGLFPVDAVPVWTEMNWAPGAPPEPVDVLRDPVPAEVPADDPAPEKKTPKAKPAAGADKNSEE